MNNSNLKIALTISCVLAVLGACIIAAALIFHINILSFVGYVVFVIGILFIVIFSSLKNQNDNKEKNNKVETQQQQNNETDFSALSKQQIISLILEDGGENLVLDVFPEKWRDDYDVALAAVEMNGKNFEYASDKLKNNMKIALTAFENGEFKEKIISQTGEELKNNYNYFAKVIGMLGDDTFVQVAKYASKNLKSDKKFAKLILSWDGSEIQYFSKEIKQDPDFVQISVENGASVSKDTDKKALLAAVKKSPHFLDDKNELLNDKEFILKVAEFYGDVYKIIPNILKFDKEFMLKLIKINKKAVEALPKKLLRDEEFMTAVNKVK